MAREQTGPETALHRDDTKKERTIAGNENWPKLTVHHWDTMYSVCILKDNKLMLEIPWFQWESLRDFIDKALAKEGD